MSLENNEQINNEEIIDDQTSAETQKADNSQVDNKVPYDRFKAKVDEVNALKEKLTELKNAKEAEERKKLEEQNDYKALFEKAQEQIESIKASAIDAKKDAMLAKAGYTDEQVERYRRYVVGETDEELANSLEQLKADIPPAATKYVDPSTANPAKAEPKQKDLTDLGREMFEKLKAKGKIK